MKKTGLYVALVLAIPLGVLASTYHQLGMLLLVAGLIGYAAALYDMRGERG